MFRFLDICRGTLVAALFFFGGLSAAPVGAEPKTLHLWHSFRGREEEALNIVIASFNLRSDIKIVSMRHEPDSMVHDIEHALSGNRTPDLFIWAHDKTGEWAESGLIEPLDRYAGARTQQKYLSNCVNALKWKRRLMGIPLSFETLIMYYNRDLVPVPPETTDDMISSGKSITDSAAGRWGLVYERGNFYHHSMWVHGFGGRVFDGRGRPDFNSDAMRRSLEFARDLADLHGIIPDTVDWKMQMELFNSGRAGMMISGPWAYGAIDLKRINLGIAALPRISGLNRCAEPFAGVKAFFVSAHSRSKREAAEAALFLSSPAASSVFSIMAGYLPAQRTAFDYSIVSADYLTSCFKDQVRNCRMMPSHPDMRKVWRVMMTEPVGWRPGCLDRVFLESVEPAEAVGEAIRRFGE